jgi:hypothetical protein
MDVRVDEAPLFVSPSTGPVLAMSNPGYQEVVVAYAAKQDDGTYALRVDSVDVAPGASGFRVQQVLLTSAGGFLIAIATHEDHPNELLLRRVELRDDGPQDPLDSPPERRLTRLVASMRNSDTVIVRGEVLPEQELFRYTPSSNEMKALAPGHASLKVIAVGESYAVARELVDGANEALYLVPVTPTGGSVGHPIPLVRGPAFSRVVLTPGDERVVATSGAGGNANTLVFDVPDGDLVDRFAGAAISGLLPEAELPGLSAVSPDGAFVVYRTQTGALALRDLEVSSSCLVRGAGASDHRIAGFSADGLIYMESTPRRVGESDVLVHDLRMQRSTVLGDGVRNHHLAAVPGRATELEEDTLPWAVAVSGGSYWAVQETAADSLGLGDVMFLPRDSGSAWVLDSHLDSDKVRHMVVSRVEPRGVESNDPGAAALDFVPRDTDFVQEVDGNREVCFSSGTPGSWAQRCGYADDKRFLGGPSLPDSEDPYPPPPEPDDPSEDEDTGTSGDDSP